MEELIFQLLMFSNSDWLKLLGDESKVDQFTNWIWTQIPESVNTQPQSWIDNKLEEFSSK